MKKVICVHLLNDYSGSPLILSETIKGLIDEGYHVDVFTNQNSQGFLSDIKGANYEYFIYKRFDFKLATLISMFLSQFILFVKLLKYRKLDAVIYVNTILPFGAGLAGKLMGKKVIYHVHETSIKPAVFKNFLLKIVKLTATKIVYVSDYLRKSESIEGKESVTIYNALSDEFINTATAYSKHTSRNKPNILMLCSLKAYKGVDDFILLANLLPEYQFTLVINDHQTQIDTYTQNLHISQNLTIHPVQKNVHQFYQNADLVLNLSHPDKWIETFGMTILEAMNYSIPVIVPPVGGIAELVMDGYNGFKLDVRDLNIIKHQIEKIFSNKSMYSYLSFNAHKKSMDFNIKTYRAGIITLVA